MLAIDVAVLDPEVICLRCDLLPDMDEVSRELAKYVPRDRQPDLVRIDDFNEHILLGVMLYSIKRTKADG